MLGTRQRQTVVHMEIDEARKSRHAVEIDDAFGRRRHDAGRPARDDAFVFDDNGAVLHGLCSGAVDQRAIHQRQHHLSSDSNGVTLTSWCRSVRAGGAFDHHHHATQRIRTDDSRVGRHPVVRMRGALLRRQERDRRLQRVDAKAPTGFEMQCATLQLKCVADDMSACAAATDRLDTHAQVEQLEFVVHVKRRYTPVAKQLDRLEWIGAERSAEFHARRARLRISSTCRTRSAGRPANANRSSTSSEISPSNASLSSRVLAA